MVIFREPERSVLNVREHRKHGKAPFAGRHGLKLGRYIGLLYVAALVAVIILIPLCRLAGSEASTLTHRQSSAMTLRLDNLKL